MKRLRIRNKDDSSWVELPVIRGSDGFSPTIEVSTTGGGQRLRITDKNGVRTVVIADGKSAYQYAVEAGYAGTEAEFAEMLAAGGCVMPVASADVLGGVKPVEKSEGMTQEVGVDEEGRLFTAPSAGTSHEAASDEEVIETLIDVDMLRAVADGDGAILSDGEDILMW